MPHPPITSPRAIPAHLLAKYSKSGPRYTSYPTAPQFRDDFDGGAIQDIWRQSNATRRGLSLYLHIPFCRERCLYCGCHTMICNSQETAKQYISALLQEVDQIGGLIDYKRPVQQLALGGGTPSFLAPETMAELIRQLGSRVDFAEDGERSIELNPETIDLDYLDLLNELGFNRFSFGVQDLDPDVQQAIGRVQDERGIAERLDHLRRLGHSSINLDLIYGLPLQTPDSFAETVNKVIRLRPSRIALFGYAHVPWISPHQKALERYTIPDAAQRTELFGLAFEQLLAAGYRHVGMDHFALPEDELIQALASRSLTRNFMGYTTRRGLDLVGLGASSISSVNGTFTQNEKDVSAYVAQAGSALWIKGLVKSAEDHLRGELILELMCNFHADLRQLEQAHGVSFVEHFAQEMVELQSMQEDGLLKLSPSEIAVSDLGRFFIRNICMPFDEYLAHDKPAGKYSKTL